MDKKKRNIIIAIGVAIIIVTIIILVSTLTRKVYTITFNSNGGTEINAVKVKKDGLLEKPEDPIKDGYVFDGWFYNDELFDFTTKIEKDITLEARYSVISQFNLNTNSLSLTVGDSATLEANEKDGLTWQSSNEEVVKVENGKVTALKEGSATITVTNKDGKTASCEVTVREKEADEVVVTKVAITGQKEVEVGSTLKLTAKITPSNATNKDVTWTSSNDTIAKVDKNGKVTALKEGTVTITVTTNNGKTATIKITVTAKKTTNNSGTNNSSTSGNNGGNNTGGGSAGDSGNTQPSNPANPDKDTTVSVKGIEVNKKDINLYVGDNETVTATVKPDNATNKNVKWSIKSGSDYVSVSNGKITGKAAGNAVVQVCSEDGNKCVEIKVTVKEKTPEKVPEVKVESITIKGNSTMNYGSSQKLSVEVNPKNATNKDVTWSVTNGATINSDGTIKITGDVEKVTVTATAKDGSEIKATFDITVNAVYSIVFTAIPEEFGDPLNYTILVTKNNNKFTDYNIIKYNGLSKPFKGQNVKATNIDKTVKTAIIVLSNGTEVLNVPVSYK